MHGIAAHTGTLQALSPAVGQSKRRRQVEYMAYTASGAKNCPPHVLLDLSSSVQGMVTSAPISIRETTTSSSLQQV